MNDTTNEKIKQIITDNKNEKVPVIGICVGIQCHPEKSHQNGVQFLKNFGEL